MKRRVPLILYSFHFLGLFHLDSVAVPVISLHLNYDAQGSTYEVRHLDTRI